MALPTPRPNDEVYLTATTSSIGSSPATASAVAPCYGIIKRVTAAPGGTTGGTITFAVSVNGGADVCNAGLTVAAGNNPRNGSIYEMNEVGSGTTSGVTINEGDFIGITISGGSGSAIPGAICIVIDKLS